MKATGLTKLDLEDCRDYPEEVSESEMDRLQFVEEDDTKKSFRAKLMELIEEGSKFPRFFAVMDC